MRQLFNRTKIDTPLESLRASSFSHSITRLSHLCHNVSSFRWATLLFLASSITALSSAQQNKEQRQDPTLPFGRNLNTPSPTSLETKLQQTFNNPIDLPNYPITDSNPKVDSSPSYSPSSSNNVNQSSQDPRWTSAPEKKSLSNYLFNENGPTGWTFAILIIGIAWFSYRHSQKMHQKMQEQSGVPHSQNRSGQKNQNSTFDPLTLPTQKFEDIGGVGGAIQELQEIAALWKQDIQGEDCDAPRVILLEGPTGVGKTHLAKAMAQFLQIPYKGFSGTDWTTRMYVGTGLQAIEADLADFQRAIANFAYQLNKKPESQNWRARGILFGDEIDAVGRARSGNNAGGGREDDKITNLLLTILDENNPQYEDIFFIFATNFADSLDPALLRSGRIHRIRINAPYFSEERLEILNKHVARMFPEGSDYALENHQDLEWLAKMARGCTGADLQKMLVEAKRVCRLEERKTITKVDLKEAFLRIKAGGRPRTTPVPEEERIKTMVHELGHAVFACIAEDTELMLLSAKPRGDYLGVVYRAPSIKRDFHTTFAHIVEDALLIMGGSMAEAVTYGDKQICTGGSSDMQNMRHTVIQLLKSGLMGTHFSYSDREDPFAIPDRYAPIIDQAISEFRRASKRVLEVLGPEWFTQTAHGCVDKDTELLGEDATQYILHAIGDEKLQEMKMILAEEIDRFTASEFGPGYFETANSNLANV